MTAPSFTYLDTTRVCAISVPNAAQQASYHDALQAPLVSTMDAPAATGDTTSRANDGPFSRFEWSFQPTTAVQLVMHDDA